MNVGNRFLLFLYIEIQYIKVILNLVATEEVGINDVDILNDCFIGFANRLIIAVSFWLKVDYVI